MNFVDLLADLAIETNVLVRGAATRLDLSVSQVYHLLLIPFNGIPMSSLAKKLGLDASTLTRNINNLERRKLIIRQLDNRDRRIQLILLSINGKDVVRNIENHLEEKIYHVLNIIDLDTQEHLITVLEKLSWALACKRN